MDGSNTFAEAVATAGERILAVGTEAELRKLAGPETEMVDLCGGLLLPGVADAHLHASDFVHNLDHLDCDGMNSVGELKHAVSRRAAEVAPDWVLGNGLSQKLLDTGLDRKALDEAAPDTPVVLVMWHGHGCVANSAALAASGISRDTPDPPGGFVRRDACGEPTGVLEEASALQLVFAGLRSFTAEEIAAKLEKMQRIMNSMGYTAYTESTVGPANDTREGGASGSACLEAYQMLLEKKKLTCRVSVGFYSGRGGKQSYEILKSDLDSGAVPVTRDENWLSFHMLKFFCDGVETSHTAWMNEEYANAPGNCGRSCFCGPEADEKEQIAELRAMLKLAHDRGYQIGIHTVGDRAVHEAMEAIIEAEKAGKGGGYRHCLIHADNFGVPEDLFRCPEYGGVVSSQPNLAAAMFLHDVESVGEERSRRMMPLRTLTDHGVVLAGGSDSIAGAFHAWLEGVRSAVLREATDGRPFHPEQSLTVTEAVRMYTVNAAVQEMAEHERGTVEAGKLADFTILDRNIFEIPPEQITDARVLRTVVGGKEVYTAENCAD